jgi:hypothetical protein
MYIVKIMNGYVVALRQADPPSKASKAQQRTVEPY